MHGLLACLARGEGEGAGEGEDEGEGEGEGAGEGEGGGEGGAHRLLSSEVYSSSFMRGASAATEGKEQFMYLVRVRVRARVRVRVRVRVRLPARLGRGWAIARGRAGASPRAPAVAGPPGEA